MEFPLYDIALSGLTCLLLLFIVTNAKSLPFAHSIRVLPHLNGLPFWTRSQDRHHHDTSKAKESRPGSGNSSSSSSSSSVAAALLFQHHVTRTHTTLMELDVFLHKSNSTYFLDADVNRAALLNSLLGRGLGSAQLIIASVRCGFRREIRPYQRYWVSSRILGWDEKRLFTVTYFLQPDSPVPVEVDLAAGPAALLRHEVFGRRVLAVMVTKFVAKAGRVTVPPSEILQACGLLGPGEKIEDVVVEGVTVKEILARGMEFAQAPI
ncbi:hypothetical protein F4778DRAFT_51199 [Xylariomycetidae sp. FL2044]|nr:hypothetical protein F4778DRAFT_51199 [Xylariomycetidae sp. FL2044]